VVQVLHDHALVVVEVGLDVIPQRRDVAVQGGGAADHLQQGANAGLDHTGVARVQPQPALRVAFLDDFAIPRLGRHRTVDRAAQQHVPQRPDHAALGLEGQVDRLERDPGLGGDRRHRGRRIPLPLKQPLRRLEDVQAGCGGLLAPVW
jgi:hypothetical protein